MLITFQICQVYNKVFYCNLNEFAFLLTRYYPVACGAFGLLQSWVVARQIRWIDMLIFCSFDWLSFQRFWKFLQDKYSSSNDTLNRSKCMCISHQRLFDFVFLSSYHLYRLLWSLIRIKVAYLYHVMLLSQKSDHRRLVIHFDQDCVSVNIFVFLNSNVIFLSF
jgi:hypothetical protein